MPVWLALKGVSSNKQKEIEESHKDKKSKIGKILHKNISYCPIVGRVAVLKPVVDKVSITYKMDGSDPTLMPALVEALLLEAEQKVHFKSAGQFQTGAVQYKASVKLVVPPDGEEVLVQAGPKKPGLAHDLRLEFNPSRLGPAGTAFLKKQLEAVLVDALDFSHVVATGTVTRLDIAVDVVGIRISDLDVRFLGEGKSHWYYSSIGQPETGYLGIKKSDKNAPWTAYNKRKQLKDTSSGGGEQLYGGLSHTRFEYHALPKKPVTDLKSVPNPFMQISVAHPIAPKGIKPYAWQFFLDACQRRGYEEALSLLPGGGLKKRYSKAMEAAHATFWRPNTIWAAWEEALSKSGLIQA